MWPVYSSHRWYFSLSLVALGGCKLHVTIEIVIGGRHIALLRYYHIEMVPRY
jgi:hypothetical protein